MKRFTEYLNENARTWHFKIKIAGPLTDEQISSMETLLNKFGCSSFEHSSTTPIQDVPLDFPRIKNAEVNIFDISLLYPATQWEIQEYLANNIGITKDAIVVRKPDEPYEEYQQDHEPREGALLEDPDYQELPNHNWDNYYGDNYNLGLIKELNEMLKEKRNNRGEKIPGTVDKYQNSGNPKMYSPLSKIKK